MAILFNAATDRITGGGITGDTATIICWVGTESHDGITQQGIMALRASGTLQLALIVDAELTLQLYDSAFANISTPVRMWPIQTYYMLAVVCSGTSFTLYLGQEGGDLQSNADTRVALNSPNELYLGDDGAGVWTNSRIADLKIYEAALTQSEIETELAGFPPARTANLVRYHPFDTFEVTNHLGSGGDLVAGTTNPTDVLSPVTLTGVPYFPPTDIPENRPCTAGSAASPLVAVRPNTGMVG